MDEAGAAVVSQNPDTFIGPVTVTISYGAPTKRPFDLDNVIKAPLDLIKSLGIIEDDNCHIVKKLTVAVDPEICGAMVTVEAA
jgi:Holliday junction resolvase RusA-like endonuclease